MPIYNVCSRCGRKIMARSSKDPFFKKILQNSLNTICNECDPKSKWLLIKIGKKGEIKINSWEIIEIVTDYGTGLLLRSNKKEIFFPPLASKKSLELTYLSLPKYIREYLRDYPFIKNILS